ncbi:MAG TPA: hypothetical protein VF857_03145, partial [Spirochaetota bacterium]
HPKSLDMPDDDVEGFLEPLIPLGLRGIEVYANMHSDDEVIRYTGMAKKHSLLLTGGSDFHGDKGEMLGFYGDARPVPESCADALLSAIGG